MGTEAFWIPAAIAAAGAGVQYKNQSDATDRENTAQVKNIQDQAGIQQKAAGEARALTSQIASNTPAQLQGKATGDYINTLRRNAAGNTQGGSTTSGDTTFGASSSALAPASGASANFNADAAKSQNEVSKYGDTYANDMGSIDAAVRQRQNEGLSMNTLGTNLNTLGAQSYTTNFINQLKAQAAGRQNPWMSLLGSTLMAGGASAAGSSLFGGSNALKAANGLNASGAVSELI